ncbi:restriction endonuclease subunit S [Kangiella sp.]|uniref:restriction endonuclease subunit S n=1 Tax=Kangiella sp. TaxID=1920245 RepID=UPI003A8FE909
MVPEGWKKGDLGNLVDTVMGYAFKSKDFVENGIQLLRMGNLYQNSLDLSRNPVFLPKSYKLEFDKYVVKPGDLVMSMTGTMGKRDYGFTVEIPLEAPDTLLNQRVIKLNPKKKTSSVFVINLLQSEVVLAKLYSYPGGTKQANLSAKQIQNLNVLIPPFPEQKKIAQILSTWDKAITTTEKLLKNSQQQKKSLMQQLLTGKKRLLDDNGVRFNGKWKKVNLENLCTVNPKKEPEPSNRMVSFISMDSVSEDARLKSFENKTYDVVSKGYTAFKDNDVILAKITPCFENGKGAYIYDLTNGVGFGSTEFHVLRAKKGISSRYIYYITCSYEFRTRGEANMQGSAGQKRVTTDYIKALKVFLPALYEEQQAISKVLSKADLEIDCLQQKIDYLKQEKKALMQQLLTGKRRVRID